MQVFVRIDPVKVKKASRSPCVISNSLEVFGDRWTLLVVRDLMFFGKHEYREFLESPEAIATNILADRLKRLVAEGIVAERLHPANKTRKQYYLTKKGKALLPVLIEMILWGERFLPGNDTMKPLFKRVKGDRERFRLEVLADLESWEAANLR